MHLLIYMQFFSLATDYSCTFIEFILKKKKSITHLKHSKIMGQSLELTLLLKKKIKGFGAIKSEETCFSAIT